MQRHRRKAPREQKHSLEALDNISEMNGLFEFHLKHRQLRADLELMKIENKLNQLIRWLQTRRLDQLNET